MQLLLTQHLFLLAAGSSLHVIYVVRAVIADCFSAGVPNDLSRQSDQTSETRVNREFGLNLGHALLELHPPKKLLKGETDNS